MKPFQKHALIALFKKWLFPPSPSPQIFLALRGTNVLGQPKDLSVSLKLGRVELKDAHLPFTEDFLSKFKEWSSGYLKYAERSRSIAKTTDINLTDSTATIPNTSVTRKPQPTIGEQTSGSILDANTFDGVTARFERSLYDLLNNDHKFSAIRDELIRILPPKGKSQPDIYIQYEDPHLAELPLHLWSVFQERGIEPVFSSLAAQAQKYSFKKSQKPRILLLLGDSTNLNLKRDIIIWKDQFPNAEIKDILVKHQSDVSKILWNERWDILYFAGHSETEDGSGKIYLSDDVSITFNDLQQGLKQSVSKGLGLAIFNSCISLGAAADLQKAGVPTIVAMRHIIHDTVAPKFLEYFLQAYLNLGKSIKNAVQIARYRLKESEETNFRCASWLPVVFQIPIILVRPKPSPLIAIATSFIVTCFVFVLHTQGVFQSAELSLYDHMMNSRRAEDLDSRIMIVQTTVEDRERQEQKGNKVAGRDTTDDELMLGLIKKLDESQPKVIGLNYWRDNSQRSSKSSQELFDRVISKSSPIIVANCTSNSNGKDPEGFVVPSGKIPDKHPHIGFINMTSDSRNNDGTIRRLLLLQHVEGSECSSLTSTSLSLRIVLDFLDKKISDKNVSSDGNYYTLNVGDIRIPSIYKGEGGYQVDPIGEVNSKMIAFSKRLSILFKFKNHESHQIDTTEKQIFSVKEIMSGDYKEKFKDKIVLIGGVNVNLDSFRIYSSKNGNSKVDNLFIHAQAIDYLLSIFEGGDILRGLNNNAMLLGYIFIDTFIFLYALYYLLTSLINNKFYLVIVLSVAFTVLIYYNHLYFLSKKSIWIPSIPIFVSILVSSIILIPQLTSYRRLPN